MPNIVEGWCHEKQGKVWRGVRLMRPTLEEMLDVSERAMKVRNFFAAENPLGALVADDSEFGVMDDVGIIGLGGIKSGEQAHAHVTFWDGRFRGRETLTRKYAYNRMRAHDLPFIWTAIPKDLKAVIAFARRVGFIDSHDGGDVSVLTLRRPDGI